MLNLSQRLLEKKEVTCPHCGGHQLEYPKATRTICHHCGECFDLVEKKVEKPKRKSRKIKTKDVNCLHCGAELRIPLSTVSWQCHECSSYLDFTNKFVDHEVSSAVVTYGNMVVRPNGFFTGPRANVANIEIAGKSLGRIVAREQMKITGNSYLMAGAEGDELIVKPFTKLESSQLIYFQKGRIDGTLISKRVVFEEGVTIGPTGSIVTDHFIFGSVKVENGGVLTGHGVSTQALMENA